MFILTMIRMNLHGRPDYIITAEHANGRTMTFPTSDAAQEYFATHYGITAEFPVYGAKVIHVPDASPGQMP